MSESLEEAAAAFDRHLSGESGKQDAGEPRAEDTADTEHVSVDEQDDVEGATPEADDEASPEDSEADDDSEAESEVEPKGSVSDDTLVTVKIDGKDEQVKLSELRDGYFRQADYTRKTQTLAHERKSFQTEAAAVLHERAQYRELLPVLRHKLETLNAEPDWNYLSQTDPAEYIRQKQSFDERNQYAAALHAEQQRLAQIQQIEAASARAERLEHERSLVLNAIPEWKDAAVRKVEAQKIIEYGASLGFSAEELDHSLDSRSLQALRKAMKYDELMAKKPRPVVNGNAPKPMRPGTAIPTTPTKTGDLTRAKQRLAKKGSIENAADVFESLLR